MKILSAVLVAAAVGVSAAWAGDGSIHRVDRPHSDRYLVLLDSEFPAAEHAIPLAREANARVVHVYTRVLNGFSVIANEAKANALSLHPRVTAVWEVGGPDPTAIQYGAPDGLDRIDQRYQPLNDQFGYNTYTQPVTIYIVDTGVDPMSDYSSRLVANINFVTVNGWRNPNNYTDCGTEGPDQVQHGSSAADVAAGTQDGVAKFAKIANVRVLRCEQGMSTWDDVIAGIDWVTTQAAANPGDRHIANASLSGGGYQPVDTAITNSVNAGVAWAVAAGNDGWDACNNSPARAARNLAGVMAVGAEDPRTDQVVYYSNQGPCVEIFAPTEVEVQSPWFAGATFGGTSAATPHVAGVMAIRWHSTPGVTVGQIESLISSYATGGVLTNLWGTSPNLLLYSYAVKRRAVSH